MYKINRFSMEYNYITLIVNHINHISDNIHFVQSNGMPEYI